MFWTNEIPVAERNLSEHRVAMSNTSPVLFVWLTSVDFKLSHFVETIIQIVLKESVPALCWTPARCRCIDPISSFLPSLFLSFFFDKLRCIYIILTQEPPSTKIPHIMDASSSSSLQRNDPPSFSAVPHIAKKVFSLYGHSLGWKQDRYNFIPASTFWKCNWFNK